jgi:hypothetical protein
MTTFFDDLLFIVPQLKILKMPFHRKLNKTLWKPIAASKSNTCWETVAHVR